MIANSFKVWVRAARLRTLPLAIAGVLMGYNGAVILSGVKDYVVFYGLLLLAILLQVLSNFANDYGDYYGGADNEYRTGPSRTLQDGSIRPRRMKMVLVILAIFILLCAMGLLWYRFSVLDIRFFGYVLLGMMSIWAAIRYTVGAGAYGYRALGDIFVLLFFGYAAVLGSYWLLVVDGIWRWPMIWLATAVGLLSVGVLNLNNIRDIYADQNAGKRTIAIWLGEYWARVYHILLILIAWLCLFLFDRATDASPLEYGYVIMIPVFSVHIHKVWTLPKHAFNPLLKDLSISTVLLVILYGLAHQFFP